MTGDINQRLHDALTQEIQRLTAENANLRYELSLMRATLTAHDLIQSADNPSDNAQTEGE